MASKLRVLLFQQGYDRPFTGAKAVSLFCKAVSQGVFKLEMPKDWLNLSREKKYKYLSKALPETYQFFLFREKQYTRKNKSAYIERMVKPIVWINDIIQKKPKKLNIPKGLPGLANNLQPPIPPQQRVIREEEPIDYFDLPEEL